MRRKKRGTFFLFIVIAFLITGVTLKRLQKSPVLTFDDFKPLNLSFDASRVSKIRLTGAGREAKLFRDKEGWKTEGIGQAQADASKVQALLKELQQARGELRGQGKSLERELKIQGSEGFTIELQDEKARPLLKTRLSLHSSNRFFFIRRETSEEVYVTNADLTSYLGVAPTGEVTGPEESFWLEAQAFRPYESLQGIIIRSVSDKGMEDKTFLMREKGKQNWKYGKPDYPFQPDQGKVQEFIGNLLSLKAVKISSGKSPAAPVLFQIELQLSGKEKKSFLVFPSENPDWLNVQPDGAEVIYSFPKLDLDKLNRDDFSFFSGKLFTIDPLKIERLVIHSGKLIVPFRPKEKKNEALAEYLDELAGMQLGRLIRDPEEAKKVKPAGPYWIEIKEEGQPLVWLDAGEPLADGMIPVMRRGSKIPFAVSKEKFELLFNDLDRLKNVSPAAAA